jgi:G3E family GTPase
MECSAKLQHFQESFYVQDLLRCSKVMACREEGDWWAAVPDDSWPQAAVQRKIIYSDFEGQFGDRRQEIVFIGSGMDRNAIEQALDAALLTDEEMKQYEDNWAKLPDPAHPDAPKV